MNPVFAAELSGSSSDNDGRYAVASLTLQPGIALPKVPGALPHVPNPPGTTIPKVGAALAKPVQSPQPTNQPEPASEPSAPVMMASVPVPEPAPLPKEGQAPPEQQPATIAGLLGNLFSASKSQSAPEPAPVVTAAADSSTPVTLRGTNTELAAKPKLAAVPKVRAAFAPVALHPEPHKAAPQPAAVAKAEPAAKPAPKQQAVQQAAREQKRPEPEIRTAYSAQTPSNSLLAGAQPVMPTGSFNSRWSALR